MRRPFAPTRRRALRLAAAAATLLALPAAPVRAAAGDEIEVVPLRYRTAEQVLPLLRPLVDPGGAVTGMQGTIVIRSNRRNIENLKQALAAFDRMPRRLMVSVRQEAGADVAASGATGGVVVGPGGVQGGGRVYSSRGASDERVGQTVQVLEGNAAFISVGQSVPVVTRSTTGVQMTPGVGGRPGSFGGITSETTGYRDVSTGFTVVPRVNGSEVILEINPVRQRVQPPGSGMQGPQGQPVFENQSVTTTVSGRLGEWIDLGGMVADDRRGERGILSSQSAARTDNRRVLVRVDEVQ